MKLCYYCSAPYMQVHRENPGGSDLEALYRKRASRRWPDRLRRLLAPPAPFVMNPAEPKDFPLGRWNLYIGGAGRVVDGYVNLDLFAVSGVDVAADPVWNFSARGMRCGAGTRSRAGASDKRDSSRFGSGRLRASGDAVLSSISRISKRLSAIHPGWTQGASRRNGSSRRRVAHRTHGDPAGRRHRICETPAAVPGLASVHASGVGMAALSAAIFGPT